MLAIQTSAYDYFRRAWGDDAANHLARYHHGTDWRERLVSWVWLSSARIPVSGEAPSMGFKGYNLGS